MNTKSETKAATKTAETKAVETTAEVKTAEKKPAKATPSEAKKAPAAKPAAEKKAAAPKKAYESMNKGAVIETIEIYVKPEEHTAYYVVNGEGSDQYKVML